MQPLTSSRRVTIDGLLREVTDTNVSTTQLLTSAKIIAARLERDDALGWIDPELNGYDAHGLEDMPQYRKVRGKWFVLNPYNGWEPVTYESSENELLLCTFPVKDALPKIEVLLSGAGESYSMHSPAHEHMLRDVLGTPFQVRFSVGATQIHNIVSRVRGLVLDWALELVKADVAGRDAIFAFAERAEAQIVTQNFAIQNVGVVGNVGGQAIVTNNQTALQNLDISAILDLVQQARAQLSSLPTEKRTELEPVLSTLESEVAKAVPNRGILREGLASARKVCEGIVGNLAATGIVGLIRPILGG